MDLEERLQQWLDDHGFQGSMAFNFSFLLRQLIFWSVILCTFRRDTLMQVQVTVPDEDQRPSIGIVATCVVRSDLNCQKRSR